MSPPGDRDDRRSTRQRAVDEPRETVLEDRATEGREATLDDERVLESGRVATVDRVLRGKLNYNTWLLLKWNAPSQMGRLEDHLRRFRFVMDTYGFLPEKTMNMLREYKRVVEATITDVDEDIDRAIHEGIVLPDEEIEWIVDRVLVAEQGHSLLIQINDALDIFTGVRLLRRMESYTSLRVSRLSRRLLERLVVLRRLLEEAKQDARESWIKATLNTSITVVTAVMPKLGILARSGILLGQMIMNRVLGDRTDVTTTAVDGITDIASKMDEFEEIRNRKRNIPRGANRVVSVTGFAFDAKDVLESYQAVDRIEAYIERAVDESDELISEIQQAKNQLEQIKESLSILEAELEQEDINVGAARDELDSMMERIGYAP